MVWVDPPVEGLASIEHVTVGRLRQRLRVFSEEAGAKRGCRRCEVEVQACFADLLLGVLASWQGKLRLVLALDANTLGST